MRNVSLVCMWAPLVLCAVTLAGTANAECFDYGSGALQVQAASGSQTSAFTCGSPPLEVSNSASAGSTWWNGTGRGLGVVNEMEYGFHSGSGWWGYTPRMAAGIHLPGLVFSGPGPTVDVAVNVVYGGNASDWVPASQDVRFDVQFRDPAGGGIGLPGAVNSTVTYAPNGPPQHATSPTVFSLPVGTPITLELKSTWFPAGPPSDLTTHAGGYMALLSTEVFSLPAGYTVDSVAAGIVGNQIPQAPAVPSSDAVARIALGLLLVACAGLGLGQRVRPASRSI